MVSAAIAALLLPALSAPTVRPSTDPVAQWRPYTAEASVRFGIPQNWIERVLRAESGGLTAVGGQPIRSKAGAMGLMQIMPATWVSMRARYRLGADPDDPHDNIVAGSAYLRLMFDGFGYPGMFAAYNAGPARYAAYLAGRSRLPLETVSYLAGVTGGRSARVVDPATKPRNLLFALRRDLGASTLASPQTIADDGLFAVRQGQR